MHKITACAALALTTFHASAAQAQDGDVITVTQQLLTPAAGMMNDHMHEGGDFMIGLRLERTRSSGANRSGTQVIFDADILGAGYNSRASAMEMDMVMVDLMFAPTDSITLMVMPHYMWHRMEMLGIDPANSGEEMDGGEGEHGHHAGIPFGEVHGHGEQGFGDTLVSASYRLTSGPALRAHATLGLWVSTGSVSKHNDDGTYVHYMMQPGSGTLDMEPALTISGQAGSLGWGGQASYRWRSERTNTSGFAFGDKARATGWLSYLLSTDLGVTARLELEHEGIIQMHYNGPHQHAAPVDRQANYGGDVVSAGLGLNWLVPLPMQRRPQLGAEVSVPLYQNLNGIQSPRDWRLSFSVARPF